MAQVLDNQQEQVRRQRMSYEAYLTYGDDTTRTEWVDGEVTMSICRHVTNTRLSLDFCIPCCVFTVDLKELGRVQIAPFEVKLWEEGPSREPDLIFVSQSSLEQFSSKRFSGAPDLAVEVISPSSLYIDRDKKFREYERAGVEEYWLIDSRPGQQRADFYRLDGEGRYALFATETDEKVASEVLKDFWLRPAWLWQEPLLNPLAALAEMVGQDAIIAALTKSADSSGTETLDADAQ